ncbi:MAG: hypothetical protein R2724_33100 [Bryobacterales bacterium]
MAQDAASTSVEPILSGLSHGSIVLGSGMGRLGPGQLGPQAGLGGPYPQTPSPFNPPANGRGMGGAFIAEWAV